MVAAYDARNGITHPKPEASAMRLALFFIGTALASALPSPVVRAQGGYYGNNSGYGDELIRCESRDGRTERCDTGGVPAEFVRQLSSSPCTRGRTWGADNYGVWVSSGCRAEFRLDRYGGSYGGGYGGGYGSGYGSDGVIRCESRDGRTNRCDTGGHYAYLVRQLSSSPCTEGSTWGSDSRGVWVSGGCRAEFRIDDRGGYGSGHGGGYNSGSGVIRCESRDNRSTTCQIPNSRRSNVRLIRQLSSTPCVEGDTWGRSAGGIWVTRGCRGEFVATRGSGGGWHNPPNDPGNAGQSIRCESNDQRTVRCNVAIYRRAELVRQLSGSPCSEGGSWGWDRSGVWVSRGCRGEFRVW
jgi:Protein of unknown function (DUF3011)